MIKSLRIQNFQSHSHSELEFHPGVNVIIGGSDSGKTAVIRALRWLIWNRPNGDSFRSTWGGNTSVEIILPERHSIEDGAHKDVTSIMRIKSDKYNQYFWNGTDNVFKAFGSDVPEPVQNILNMDVTNVQNQLDSPFLISSTPGEVASYFNKVAHLDQIDTGLKNVQSSIAQITKEIKASESRSAELIEYVKAYDYIDLFDIDLEMLEKMDVKWKNGNGSVAVLEGLIHNIVEIDIKIAELEYIVFLEDEVNNLLKFHETRKKENEEHRILDEAIINFIEILSELKYLDSIIQLEEEVQDIYELRKSVFEKTTIITSLQTLVQDLEDSNTDLAELKQNIKVLTLKFHDELGSECPLCGTKLNPSGSENGKYRLDGGGEPLK